MTSSTPTRPLVLIVAPRIVGTFIEQDRALLANDFDVELYPFSGARSFGTLKQRIENSDIILIWFAGRHAPPAVWLARRYRKPVVTIVGGYEVEWIPSISYGVPPNSWRRRIVRWVLKNSDRLVAVSGVTHRSVLRVAPESEDKLHLTYNAVDTERFATLSRGDRYGVLCVGMITRHTIKVKGWDRFRDIAASLPGVEFCAIGPLDDVARKTLVADSPPNITWRGQVTGPDLIAAYQRASVYLQCSVHESFSLALAEAMACGCIPVTTQGGALPEVAGDTGFFIDTSDIGSSVQTVSEALQSDPDRRRHARRQIVDNFSVADRQRKLSELLLRTLDKG